MYMIKKITIKLLNILCMIYIYSYYCLQNVTKQPKRNEFVHYITHIYVWCTYSFYGYKYQAFADNDIRMFLPFIKSCQFFYFNVNLMDII